jgi:hypothetical protein
MTDKDGIVKLFSGDEISVIHLKDELETADIETIIRNDYQSGTSAGFYAGPPSSYELFVLESDVDVANDILQNFLNETPD